MNKILGYPKIVEDKERSIIYIFLNSHIYVERALLGYPV